MTYFRGVLYFKVSPPLSRGQEVYRDHRGTEVYRDHKERRRHRGERGKRRK